MRARYDVMSFISVYSGDLVALQTMPLHFELAWWFDHAHRSCQSLPIPRLTASTFHPRLHSFRTSTPGQWLLITAISNLRIGFRRNHQRSSRRLRQYAAAAAVPLIKLSSLRAPKPVSGFRPNNCNRLMLFFQVPRIGAVWIFIRAILWY